MLQLLVYILGLLSLVGLVTYFLPLVLVNILPEQNLSKKYNAKWAFVTGASSGLGYAIARKCASQGLNVVLCALDDDLLKTAHNDLRKGFPKVQFRVIGCNLGDDSGSYYSKVVDGTSDIDIQVVFSNAGYLLLKAFYKTDLNQLKTNFHCNITSHVVLAHYFFGQMAKKNLRGCIVFTSSLVGYMPAPANALYGAAKASLTQLASCLAIEGAAYGIDVMSIQAGPMKTRFTKDLTPIDALQSFYKVASTPEQVTEVLFKSVGRIAVRDHSFLNMALRLVLRVIDVNLLIRIISISQPYTEDWKKYPDLH